MGKSTQQYKHCNKCNQDKPVDQFTKNSRMEDGLNNFCKACTREYSERRKQQYNEMLKKYHPELFEDKNS